MKIELRDVKYAAFSSEESNYFKATVCIDGERVGTVSNDGLGGKHWYNPTFLGLKLTQYAETLPPYKSHGTLLSRDADSIIDDAFEDYQLDRLLKPLLSENFVFLKPNDDTIHLIKPNPREEKSAGEICEMFMAQGKQDLLRIQLGADKLLNILPYEEAFQLYKSSTQSS